MDTGSVDTHGPSYWWVLGARVCTVGLSSFVLPRAGDAGEL